MIDRLTSAICLPVDRGDALLVGRAWLSAVNGPAVVVVRDDVVYDVSSVASTVSGLLDMDEAAERIRAARGCEPLGPLDRIMANSAWDRRSAAAPWLLAPCDLHALKAAGVTFVASMIERVIEEQAGGDASKAESVRQSVAAVVGDNLRSLKPGSAEARQVKAILTDHGLWSQYLEVGIGPDAEIFTKSQPMSAVGTGADVGIHPGSEWNNPEPEVVLAVNSRGGPVGASVGNDVNLRDFEGRSALLLGRAKDNNASCAIGPFIRLFDEGFSLDDVRHCELALQIDGPDGFSFEASGSMATISRDPEELLSHTIGPTHQYPDGLMLFLGTMFVPPKERGQSGKGFGHIVGDIVTVSTPRLGALINRVNYSDKAEPWTFGAACLMRNLGERGLI